MAKLGEIAIVQSGGTPARSKKEYWQNGCIPWVKISDIKDKHIKATEEKITEIGLNNSSAKIFPAGTILYTIFATLGETAILDIKAATNQAIAGITVIDKRILPEFLYYYLVSQKENVAKMGRGVAQNNINMSLLKDFEVPVLELRTQEKIIHNLIQLDNLIFLRKQQLTKLDELVKARFVEMFRNITEENSLENLCCFIDYRGKTPEKSDSGFPFITAKNIRMHYMSFDTLEFISKETYDKVMTRGTPKVGDVVFTTEAPLGNVCRIPKIDTNFYIGQRIITMQTQFLNPVYLEYALSSDDFKKKLDRKSSGSTVTGIRSKLLGKLTIPVPSKELQNNFATFVEHVDQQKQTVQQSLEKLELMKKALMQEYFW